MALYCALCGKPYTSPEWVEASEALCSECEARYKDDLRNGRIPYPLTKATYSTYTWIKVRQRALVGYRKHESAAEIEAAIREIANQSYERLMAARKREEEQATNLAKMKQDLDSSIQGLFNG